MAPLQYTVDPANNAKASIRGAIGIEFRNIHNEDMDLRKTDLIEMVKVLKGLTNPDKTAVVSQITDIFTNDTATDAFKRNSPLTASEIRKYTKDFLADTIYKSVYGTYPEGRAAAHNITEDTPVPPMEVKDLFDVYKTLGLIARDIEDGTSVFTEAEQNISILSVAEFEKLLTSKETNWLQEYYSDITTKATTTATHFARDTKAALHTKTGKLFSLSMIAAGATLNTLVFKTFELLEAEANSESYNNATTTNNSTVNQHNNNIAAGYFAVDASMGMAMGAFAAILIAGVSVVAKSGIAALNAQSTNTIPEVRIPPIKPVTAGGFQAAVNNSRANISAQLP